jgi:hypothetical protein
VEEGESREDPGEAVGEDLVVISEVVVDEDLVLEAVGKEHVALIEAAVTKAWRRTWIRGSGRGGGRRGPGRGGSR